MVKTFVINLPSSVERRELVKSILSKENFIDYEIIDAVDGRKMTDEEKNNSFDIKYAEKFYGREVKSGEIGCTLSHQKCYKTITERNLSYALILEDDFDITEPISDILKDIEKVLLTDDPVLILLSGRFYFTKKEKLSNTSKKLGKVVDAYLSHAYLINKAAAKIAFTEKPWFMADNWKYFKNKGINVMGLIPHCIDQNRDLPSEIMGGYFREFKFKSHFFSRWFRRGWHMLFNIFGHFEKASNKKAKFRDNYL